MSTQTTIDLPTFESLKESMGADFINELLDTYFIETLQLLSSLHETLTNNDSEGFRRAAHSIKSTSNSFGALQFGEQAKELEMIGRDGKLEGVSVKVDALASGFGKVRQALEELSHG